MTDGRTLHLEPAAPQHRLRYETMMDEWEAYGGRLNPGALRRFDKILGRVLSFEEWMRRVETRRNEAACMPGEVPQHLYFLVDGAGTMLGAVSIRTRLNEELLATGGHIGLGIRPSARRQGLATELLSMALPVARSLGIDRLLYTCAKDNIGSAKAVLRCGGILENEIDCEGGPLQRYWIAL